MVGGPWHTNRLLLGLPGGRRARCGCSRHEAALARHAAEDPEAAPVAPVKRAVAVKVIKAGMDSEAMLARFVAERQALAMTDHQNIARVLDAGATDGGRPSAVSMPARGARSSAAGCRWW